MREKMSSDDDLLLIGLTGPFGSGCSTVADILSDKVKYRKQPKYNFSCTRISDVLKAEAQKQGIDIAGMDRRKRRKTLQDIGNKLRKEKGPGILVQSAIREARSQKHNLLVIESIKNPGEVIELKKYPNAFLMAIDAPYDVRWKRVKDIYGGDQHQFDLDNTRDRNEGVAWGQNVQKCIDLADIFTTNEIDIDAKSEWENFEINNVDRNIKLIKKPGSEEPSTMELMMNNAYCTSLLSTCGKRQVGAVITITEVDNEKDLPKGKKKLPKMKSGPSLKSKEYVIATGYNAVPEDELCCEAKYGECFRDKMFRESIEKLKHCPSCGIQIQPSSNVCPKCHTEFKKLYPSKSLDLCRSLHAEENAILQTARLGGGISLIGATIYTTTFPCLLCVNKILATGIDKIVWLEAYPDQQAMRLLKEAEQRGTIELVEFQGVKAEAFYRLFNKKHSSF